MRHKTNILSFWTKFYAFTFVGCVISAILFKWIQTGIPFGPQTILVFAIFYLEVAFITYWALQFFRYFERKTHLEITKQFIPALILFWVGYMFISLVLVFACDFVFYWLTGYNLNTFLQHFVKVELLPFIKMASFWVFLGSLIFFYILWRKAMNREQRLKEENLIFRYETLKNQVNPHFLFNSLNTLSSLVKVNPEVAEQYINKLASIYRYILENSQKDRIPLQSEIAFINDYFFMQKIRDEEKIQLNIQLNNCSNFLILPISLQILIENALKHNMATREKPLQISLYCENGYIIVKNNLQKMTHLGDSPKIGLKNLQERLQLITRQALIIEETNNEFTVKLPMIAANENTNS